MNKSQLKSKKIRIKKLSYLKCYLNHIGHYVRVWMKTQPIGGQISEVWMK